MAVRSTGRHAGDTKSRILDAAETLFIENGYEAMSLRQITSRAEVNLAAVNYHFGSKEALMHAMLSRRLDRLNQERLKLLDRFDTMLGDRLTCEHVLGAMFIPALRLSRDSQVGGKAFLRLLGRAYTDPSSFIRDFLAAHYATVAERFFTAFQRALPHLPREELGWRLHFAIGALSGVLAGADTESLIVEFSQGKSMNDLQLIARLASLMVSALKAPLPDMSQLATFAAVLGDAADGTDASEVEQFCPLVGVAKAAAQQGTADAPVRSVETSPAATTGFSPAASASPRTVTNVETRPAANAASSTATNTDTGSIASANAEPKESSANALHGDASKPVTEAGSTHASAQDSSAGNEVRSVRDDGSATDRPASEPRDVARRDAEPQLNATLETREARETRDTRGDTLDARHDEDEGDDDRATHRDGTSRSEQRPHHRVA